MEDSGWWRQESLENVGISRLIMLQLVNVLYGFLCELWTLFDCHWALDSFIEWIQVLQRYLFGDIGSFYVYHHEINIQHGQPIVYLFENHTWKWRARNFPPNYDWSIFQKSKTGIKNS